MRASVLVLAVLATCVSSTQARIYNCKDQDGNTVYSDTPSAEACQDAEEVSVDDLPDLIETKPLAIPTSSPADKTTKQDADEGYESLMITSPNDQDNLRSNEGILQISYQATPALKTAKKHQYVITLGGKEVYRGAQTNVTLKNIDRGTHVVNAKIIAKNGKTLINSKPTQFTVQRFSVLQGPVPGASPGGSAPGAPPAPGAGSSPIPGSGSSPTPGGGSPSGGTPGG